MKTRDSCVSTLVRTMGLGVAAVAVGPPAAAGSGTFEGLGFLAGGVPHSEAYAVSGDGITVVGYSSSAPGRFEAFRWTQAAGMTSLGNLTSNGIESRGLAASVDGAVIVGSGGFADPTAFRWTQADGMVAQGNNSQRAFSVSADGAVVVGERRSGSDLGAFRWTADTGVLAIPYLPHPPQWSPIAAALGVSDDGAVVVGHSTSHSGQEAFRWTQATGTAPLGDLPGGGFNSGGRAASSDGSVIVGYGTSAFGTEAFRWTPDGGMVGLGDLTGGAFSSAATACSADGAVIVGASQTASGAEAFIWDAQHGMRNLRELLTEGSPQLTGWILTSATGISADGRTVVGLGINHAGQTEAWRAVLASDARFEAGDLNCDGAIDFFDIDPFLLALFDPSGYLAAYPDCDRMLGDLNSSGGVDFFDIDPFLVCLLSTCP